MEVMLVVALVAVLITMVAWGFGFVGRADVQGESLRFSALIRYIFNQAATQNMTLQLVIDLDEGTFTVDALELSGAMSLDDLAGRTLKTSLGEHKSSTRRAGRLDDEDTLFGQIGRQQQAGPFISGEDARLKDGVYFVGVMTSHHETLQSEGVATINFFPSGFVERSVIYIGDEDARATKDKGVVYTLLVNPLNGQTSVLPGRVPIEERFFAEEEAD